MIRISRCDLYVLAGGHSTRFGTDKALADVDGHTMLQGVIDPLRNALSNHSPSVTLVTGESRRYEALGFRVIMDKPANIGPMGGLHAALEDRLSQDGPGWLMLSGCDWVRPQTFWAQPLLASLQTSSSSAIAYYQQKWQPMLALYHTRLLPIIGQMIKEESTSLQGLLNQIDATRISPHASGIQLTQANTPDQLARALKEPARS